MLEMTFSCPFTSFSVRGALSVSNPELADMTSLSRQLALGILCFCLLKPGLQVGPHSSSAFIQLWGLELSSPDLHSKYLNHRANPLCFHGVPFLKKPWVACPVHSSMVMKTYVCGATRHGIQGSLDLRFAASRTLMNEAAEPTLLRLKHCVTGSLLAELKNLLVVDFLASNVLTQC